MLTVGRFLASLVLFALLVFMESRDPGWALPLVAMILFIVVVATDALDGYLARKYRQVTDFGRIADPVADKILVCGTFIFLCASDWCGEWLPAWIVVAIVAREFLVTGIRGFIEARGQSFAATWSGKLKMIFQSIAIPALFLRQFVRASYLGDPWLETYVAYFTTAILALALLLTVYSGILYILRAARILMADGE